MCFCGPERPGKAITVRAVARGDEPALEPQAVARCEADVLVRGAEVRGRDDRARSVRGEVPDRDRHQERRNQHDDTGKNEAAAEIAAAATVIRTPRPPERPDPDPEQNEAAGQGEEAGEVVTGGSVRVRVVDRLDAGDDAEEAEEERQRRTCPRPQARVCPGGGDDQCELCQPARQMVDGRHARLGLQEVVVHDVEPDKAERAQGEVPLGGEARQGA